jgi:phosphoribosylamine--glycine ligase
MGTFSPSHRLDATHLEEVRKTILDPFVQGIQVDGIQFRGLLFPGLMLTKDGPRVLEFNCRFGDPETQVLMPRLQSDIVDLLEATIAGNLGSAVARWDERSAVCVVMASGGYPGSYEAGKTIVGLDEVDQMPDVAVFHAGTRVIGKQVVTSGGRVLGVTAFGETLLAAKRHAYDAVDKIKFDGSYFRRDIGSL